MKKVITLFFLAALLLGVNTSNAQWAVRTLPLVANEDLYGISFLNDSTAYISSNTEITYCTNNFNNFSPNTITLQIGAGTAPAIPSQVNEIYFSNVNTGLITGQFDLLNDYDVYGTTTSGGVWTINYTSNTGGLPRYFLGMDVNGTGALACGSLGRIVKSSNSGTTWSPVTSGTSAELTDVAYITPSSVIAVGQNIMLRSANGGTSWTVDNSFPATDFNNVSLTNGNTTVYACSSSKIFKSTNSGTTFTTQTTPFTNINYVKAQNNDTIFIGTNTGVYTSYNSGASWEQFISTQSYFVNRVEIKGTKVYALCRDAFLLIADLTNLHPQPVANYSYSQNTSCDSTILQLQNLSSSFYSYQWHLNAVLVSTNYNYNKTYTTAPGVGQVLTLIVSNGVSTDTLTQTIGITVKTKATSNIGYDKYDCYGQTVSLAVVGAPSGQTYNWTPHALISGSFTASTANTIPLNGNLQIYLTANNADNCPTSDTINIYSTAQITEPFWVSEPSTVNLCSNAPCNAITALDFVSPLIGFGLAQSGEFIKTIDGGTTWTTTLVGTSTDNASKRGIDFIDENIGYVVANSLKKTIDGGATFTSYPTGGISSAVNFMNKDTGIFSSQGTPTYENHGYAYITFNGGATVSSIYSYVTHGYFFIQDVKIVNPSIMFLAGSTSNYNYPPLIKKTTDGGATWTTLPVPGTRCIHQIQVFGTDTIFAINGIDYVYKSVDGGLTWSTYQLCPTTSAVATSLKMMNSQVGYAGANAGGIYETTNGGDCWQQVFNTGGYNQIYAIAIPPTNDVVAFTGEVVLTSSIKPKVFVTQYYRKLLVSIDSNWCGGNAIHTHNLSTGYTSYKWYLDNILYSQSRDTTFLFSTTGTHTVRLDADSAGTGIVSTTFNLTIIPALGSVGSIYGPSGVCTNYSLFPTGPQWSAPDNSSVTTWHWSSDFASLIAYGLEDTDSIINPYFFGNISSSWALNIFVYGTNAMGCVTTDTAVKPIHTRINYLSTTPTIFNTNTLCFNFDTIYGATYTPYDTILCSTSANASADYYIWESYGGQGWYTSIAPNFAMPIYGNCPEDNHQIILYLANACGSAMNGLSRYYYSEYPNYTATHTPDTIVNPSASFWIYSTVDFGYDIENNCYPSYNFFHDGVYFNNDWQGSFYLSNVTAADTGLYSVTRKNGCDSVVNNIRVSFQSTVGISNSNTLNDLNLLNNISDGTFTISNPLKRKIDYEIYSSLGTLVLQGHSEDEKQQINLNKMGNGNYYLKMTDKESKYSVYKKIAVVK